MKGRAGAAVEDRTGLSSCGKLALREDHMDEAKMRFLGKVLGGVQILGAIFYLDTPRWNGIMVSVLLFLGGVTMLITHVRWPLVAKLRSILAYTSIVIALGLMMKLATIG
jgi:hypothetical protein